MPADPVSLEEMKLHLRVDHEDEDAYIAGLVAAATKHVEDRTARRLMDTAETQYFDAFADPMELTRSPVNSVTTNTSIIYTDTTGTTQTLAAATYDVDATDEPGVVRLAYDQSYPTTRAVHDAVVVTYVAGYGADASAVPEGLKLTIKFLVTHWYEHRLPVGKAMAEIPYALTALLWQFKVPAADS